MTNQSEIGDGVWTLGIWQAKSGREQEFATLWQDFAAWTCKNLAGADYAYLMRDAADANRFFSFGPWESVEAVTAWRETPQFRDFVRAAGEVCDSFQPFTLLPVHHVTR